MTIYTDPEDQIAAEIAEMEAKGLDPYADRAPDPGPEDQPEAKPEPAAVQAPEPEDKVKTPEPAAAAETAPQPEAQAKPDEIAEPAKEPVSAAPQAYRAEVPADLAAKRAELVTEKSEALAKLMGGEIDAKEYATVETRVTEGLEALTLARARAETLTEVNRQSSEGYQGNVIKALVARSKPEIDYLTDAVAQQRFDTTLKLLANDPEFVGKDFAEIADEAHSIVMARAGLVVAKPAATPKPAPDRTPPKPPVTLSGLPTAAASGTKSVAEVAGRLAGDDLEKAFDALSDADLKKLMSGKST